MLESQDARRLCPPDAVAMSASGTILGGGNKSTIIVRSTCMSVNVDTPLKRVLLAN